MNRHADHLERLARIAETLAGLSPDRPPVVVLQRRAGHHENSALDQAARALYLREYGVAPDGPAIVVQLEGNTR